MDNEFYNRGLDSSASGNMGFGSSENASSNDESSDGTRLSTPKMELPKGGGAIKGIGEKFQVNAINGTSSFAIALPLSPSRHAFVPTAGLSYSSGNGNGPFGIGWELGIPQIQRKTENQLPKYYDEDESDTYTLSGVEDLIPMLDQQQDGSWKSSSYHIVENGVAYTVRKYRPRIDGLFARIEKWKEDQTGITHWRTVTAANIHAYFGMDPASKIIDPSDGSRIFCWLLSRTHDDKGNICINEYKPEDFKNIPPALNEKNRMGLSAQTYLKTVFYGNKTPYYLGGVIPQGDDFMFRMILDYGEHDTNVNIPSDIYQEKNLWDCRNDPFSSYRSGFEIRTYRRCGRVLFFHCFDKELPLNPCLVKSLQLFYDEQLEVDNNGIGLQGFSFLIRARQNGHIWQAQSNYYSTKYIPELNISYQKHAWNTEWQPVLPDDRAGSPVGPDNKTYLWTDLYSEGIAGILTEQAEGWFYKSNRGGGKFSIPKEVTPIPSFRGISKGTLTLQELEGNGVKYLVQWQNQPAGFFRIDEEDSWQPMKNFEQLPHLDPDDPDLRSLDLDGDGIADILNIEDNTIVWYKGLGEKGFQLGGTLVKETDEEKGPAVVFSDQTQTIFLADMSGDGMTDIVRIRNSEICYWPNLGYGRFGAKVNMDNPPVIDFQDRFNPAFIRLADIDGSGTTDLVYLGKNNLSIWMNLNGNQWTTDARVIPYCPGIDNLSNINVIDFLGTGTASVVYSSPLDGSPYAYLDLMKSQKPGLLSSYLNQCGKEVTIEYLASTVYYLKDKEEGKPWVTKLPFPVQCISRVITKDRVRQTIFASSYRYSHGYYDSKEREFRGFARAEQYDTEDFDIFSLNTAKNVVADELHQPPVKTVSWYHTGACLQGEHILHQCQNEYFKSTDFAEYVFPEPILTANMTAEEFAEALRACKGLLLRSEIYAMDKDPVKGDFPYKAVQSNSEIRMLQPKLKNRYASFQTLLSESINYTFDRVPSDPRISHSFTLNSDLWGNTLQSALVVYPRLKRPVAPNDIPDDVWTEQNKMYITYSETDYTNDISEDDVYLLRLPCESRAYEISGITPSAGFYFDKATLYSDIQQINALAGATIQFETEFDGSKQRRLSAQSRSYFINDLLNGPLPLGTLSPLAIFYNSFSLSFTPGLVTKYYGAKLPDSMLTTAGYTHSEGDLNWWAQSGIMLYSADPKSDFYTPIGAKDVFGNPSYSQFDQYKFLVLQTTDAIGASSSALYDYRTLNPYLITDTNLNRSTVQTDELGMVTATAIMGKDGSNDGDTLSDPSVKIDYDLFNWQNHQQPNRSHILAREVHGPTNTRWQESYTYTDGSGSVIMTKNLTTPGTASHWNPVTKTIDQIPADPRWIGNGRTILNNKGKVVKQYEAYFSTVPDYESEDALVEQGFSPLFYYDPIGRNIRTEAPNGTFSTVEINSWSTVSYDFNDNVKRSQWYIDRGSPNPLIDPEPLNDPDKRAAWLAAKHADTPAISYSDSLGRTFYAISDYGSGKTTQTKKLSDATGRFTNIYDQKNRLIGGSFYNLAGFSMYGKTAEKGERWTFNDVIGRPARAWDNNVRELYTTFDVLHRPVSSFIVTAGKTCLFKQVFYGDVLFDKATAQSKNILGRTYRTYDQGGSMTADVMDFKGTMLQSTRRIIKDYTVPLTDWSVVQNLTDLAAIDAAANPLLDTETFTESGTVDALNRPVQAVLPGGSIYKPTYNVGGYLGSLDVQIMGQANATTFLSEHDFNAKGQRLFVRYGNHTTTTFTYESETNRLINLLTRLKDGDTDASALQNITATYDPVGNITDISDDAQETYFFKNSVVFPENMYEYDAIYQLVRATGREHVGVGTDTQPDNNDLPCINQLPDQSDLTAVRSYIENYYFDDCGNINRLQHTAQNGNWNRYYHYGYEDDPSDMTNRLKSTSLPGDAPGVFSGIYTYDNQNNIASMPHLPAAGSLSWDFADKLKQADLGGGGKAYYIYSSSGSRLKKIIERRDGSVEERIYLGSAEIYRKRTGTNAPSFERYTIHVSDGSGKIAQVDIKTIDTNNTDQANPILKPLTRYQYSNPIGSSMIEADDQGVIISYEEYHPFGTSSYRLSLPGTDISFKRYRFSGKERDDETGFYYFGARYYAEWLGRWISTDPSGYGAGTNLWRYCSNNPVMFHDPDGRDDNTYWQSAPAELQVPGEEGRQQALDFINSHYIIGVVNGTKIRVTVNATQVTWIDVKPGQGQSHWQGTEYTVLSREDLGPTTGQTGENTYEPINPPNTDEDATEGDTDQAGTPEGSGDTAASPSGTGTSTDNSGTNSDSSNPDNGSGTQNGSGGASPNDDDDDGWSFWKGLALGVLVAVAIVAVVATGGAALAALAPAAAEALAASTTVAAIGTGLQVAGAGLVIANTVQSLRHRDLLNNEISPSKAHFNLGFGIGSLAAGPLSKPIGNAVTGALGLGKSAAAAANAGDELVTVFRGMSQGETQIVSDSGYVFSDAGKTAYRAAIYGGQSVDEAIAAAKSASEAAHSAQLATWGGSMEDYVQAHGAFGTEYTQAFGPRSLISFTTDAAEAAKFAGKNGTVISAAIPKSALIPQTLPGAGESEHLIAKFFKIF